MNFKLEGYNECLITVWQFHLLHPIAAAAYHKGWARNGAIVSGASQWNSSDFNYNGATGNVGPMFWSHYSYLGLDPSTLKINMLTIGFDTKSCKNMHQYSIANPKQWKGLGFNS
jgi:hypothetical protein